MAEKEEQTGREDTNKTSWGKTIKKGTSEQTASGLHLKEKEVLPAASEAEGQDRGTRECRRASGLTTKELSASTRCRTNTRTDDHGGSNAPPTSDGDVRVDRHGRKGDTNQHSSASSDNGVCATSIVDVPTNAAETQGKTVAGYVLEGNVGILGMKHCSGIMDVP